MLGFEEKVIAVMCFGFLSNLFTELTVRENFSPRKFLAIRYIFCFASATCWICMWVGGHYSLLANARQIYGATAIKSVRVIAQKTIMTVEAAGLSGRGC